MDFTSASTFEKSFDELYPASKDTCLDMSDSIYKYSLASTSASSVQKSFKYDVFLSFRGEDTRKNFVDHLYYALLNKGIITYKDDEKIQKGERISDQLIESIEDSRFHIIVFSKNYASSSWCLDELVKIMECQKKMENTAYPIFYDVEPTEVRNQRGAVGAAFAKHENEVAAGKWRDALKQAADLAGWELKNTYDGHEAKFIQKIVEDISLKPYFINSCIGGKLVGMITRVENVISSLEINSDDVRIIGIKGIGGGGKTTLARVVFDHLSRFEGKSFVENVREGSKRIGLNVLQEQVLRDVLSDQNINVTSVSDGKIKMKRMMPSRKALVILDDVDDTMQVEALAGELTWFKPGSRIIITTRDEQVLRALRVNFIHDVSLLSDEEAICLFSRHAFEREIPIQGYEELSRKVVQYAAGLPLTIKVLGSHLCDRSEWEWEDAIERLKEFPLKETLEKLELSYNGLEIDQKEIFLDVVCILKGKQKDMAIRILESCGFNAKIGLRVLEQKSLITISSTDTLGFHDHIEEMGWNIVRRMHPNKPSKHSRLWIEEEIEDILGKELGTEATRSLKLNYTDIDPTIIMKGLRKMKELRLLYVHYGLMEWNVSEVSQYLPDSIQSVCWHRYPFQSFFKPFTANKLFNLEMIWSNISQLWEVGDKKVLSKLRYLDLSWSVLRTFDLGMTPHLETLILAECFRLEELHMRVQCPKLKVLNLSGTMVSNLNLGMTPHLKELNLKQCYFLETIYAPVGCLKKLVNLYLSWCLRFEEFLVVTHRVPGLDSSAALELDARHVDNCPSHPKSYLPKFRFKCKYAEPLPSLSGNLERLISFGLCYCTNLESFSASICSLQQLRELTLKGSIPEVPKDLGQLQGLQKLSLWMKDIKHLPESICMLKRLKYLNLTSCLLLEQLPNDLGRLECLEELYLRDCRSLQEIPVSICKMNCLKLLDLCHCILIKELPEELGRLESLEVSNIEGAGISRILQIINQPKGMRIIGSKGQLQSYGFTSLTETPTYTYVQL